MRATVLGSGFGDIPYERHYQVARSEAHWRQLVVCERRTVLCGIRYRCDGVW